MEAKRLTIAEIDVMYPEQFVLLDEPEVDEWNRVVSGIVRGADADKSRVCELAGELNLTRAALRCTKDRSNKKYAV